MGHEGGAIFRTENATATEPSWELVGTSGANPLPARYCTCITVDPHEMNVVYVAFGGYKRGNLWVTRDAGTTWTNLATGLPPAPIRAIAVHPRHARVLYIGTEVGIFASDNAGVTWSPTNEGPTNCSVDDLLWMNETLVCVTHGRGMFTIDLSEI